MPEMLFDCQDYPEICGELEGFLSEKLSLVFKNLNLPGDVTIKIGSEEESKNLNQTYRNKDSSTDVLSFILNDFLPDGSCYCGDIHIAYPVAARQAAESGHSIYKELLILAVHGLLHLSGLDHEIDEGMMMSKQNEIILKLMASDF